MSLRLKAIGVSILKRWDIWTSWLMTCLLIVYWSNPLAVAGGATVEKTLKTLDSQEMRR